MKFAKFMASGTGRGLRAVVGVVLVWWGLSMHTGIGYGVAAFGVVAILSGLINFCLIAPLLGVAFLGKNLPSTSNTPNTPNTPSTPSEPAK